MPSDSALVRETGTWLNKAAQSAIVARQHRMRFFSPAMFGEPAWDLLLALCAWEQEHVPIQVTMLAQAARTPPTTALRWLSYLEAQELIARDACEHDQRAQLVRLTDKGRRALESYFSQVSISVRL